VIDDWIKQLERAQTPKALVKKPADADAIAAAEPLSEQYAKFLRSHGEIRAFPSGRAHRLHVRAQPRAKKTADGQELLEFGNDDGSPVYFLPDDERIYSIEDSEVDEVAGDFEEWLDGAFQRIHDQHSEHEWQELLDGAPPFSPEEQAVVAARRRYDVTIEGIEPDRKLRLRVHNGSDRKLPWLTVGVRASDPPLEGAVWLDVSKLDPGATTTMAVDAYGKMTDPRNIELLDLPDPTPADRSSFRELSSKR
jgi:hypothetical protein